MGNSSFCAQKMWSLIAMAFIVGMSPLITKGQDNPTIIEAVAAHKATGPAPGWRVVVTFSESFTSANESQVEDENHYRIFHAESGTLVPITDARIASSANGRKHYSMVVLQVSPLTEGGFYHLYVTGLIFGEKPLTKPIVAPVDFGSSDDDQTSNLPITAAEDREDANLFIAGEITRASGTDFTGSADVKVSYVVPETFWGRTHFFEPLFDLKANSDPEADPDTMKFGLDWDFALRKNSGSDKIFNRIRWKNSFLIEAERDFDNSNFIWGTRLVFPSRALYNKSRTVRFFLRPFVGFEFGKNINSPVREAENKGLARGVFGSTMNLAFPLERKNLSSISLEASYQRRLLMLKEVYFEKAEDDSLRPAFFGRSPRQWIEAKLSFNFTDQFGMYIGYEYGQEPPSYKLVDHRMKIGLTYKIKFKKPDE